MQNIIIAIPHYNNDNNNVKIIIIMQEYLHSVPSTIFLFNSLYSTSVSSMAVLCSLSFFV